MIKSFIKLMTGSMTARIFLLLVGGTLVSAALVLMLASHERDELETRIRIRHTAERAEQIILMLDALPPESRPAIANIAANFGIRVDFTNSTVIIGKVPDTNFTLALKQVLGNRKSVTALDRVSKNCPIRQSDKELMAAQKNQCETILTNLKDGTPVWLDVGYHIRATVPFQQSFLKDIFMFLTALMLIALLVAHMSTKPLRKLAKAAQDLGRDIEHNPLPENTGSTEVREASIAFNSMQASIRSYIQERTYMLAAVAHDLQTPLTRLRLRLEKVSDEDLRNRLIADLSTTQDMVREGLDFAQSINSEETFELIDIDSLIEAICNDATDAGCDVTLNGKVGMPIRACPNTLRRCITNLLDNAIKYGTFAHVMVKQEHSKAIISIIDGGPGIPEDKLEMVFQPFHRVESSRSRDSAGTGLGLTIARIIAHKHKGTIKLQNMGSSELGLIATLELPLPNKH